MATAHRSDQSSDLRTDFPDASLGLVREHSADGYARLRDAYELSFQAADPALLELARMRIAQIVNPDVTATSTRPGSGVTPAKAAALSEWSTAEIYNEAERACLAFTEQFAFYVGNVSDEQINDLLAQMPADEVYGLINGIYVIDAVARLSASVTKIFDQGEAH